MGKTLLDPLAGLEDLGQPLTLVADGGDHGALGAHEDLGRHPQRLDVGDHVVDLLAGRVGLHHDNHGDPSSKARPAKWAGTTRLDRMKKKGETAAFENQRPTNERKAPGPGQVTGPLSGLIWDTSRKVYSPHPAR